MEQTWVLDEWGFCEDPQTLEITEFRGNGRQRYMVRERDPTWADTVLPDTTRWSDYDGDEIYGDYVVDDETGDVTNSMAYLPGVAQIDALTGVITYFHGDQIGSLRAVSDEQSAVSGASVYTAFGEQVYADGTVGTRYQYAGAWGYESSDRSDALADLGWVHVGHRYYDPSTGRFLQRDPIGIQGGLNVYAYVFNAPTMHVDPDGECIGLIVIAGAAGIVLITTDTAEAPGPNDAQADFERRRREQHEENIRNGVTAVSCVVAGPFMRAVGGWLGKGGTSLLTNDPGFLRWGPGWVPQADKLIWRIAIGGPRGAWRFHIHIHRFNWWKPWWWLMR